MVDWPGLLKWSINYHDKEKISSDFTPMDKETKLWLTEAL
jgi:hypothetical protein